MAAEARQQLSPVPGPGLSETALQGNLFGAPEDPKPAARLARPGALADPGELDDAALEADAGSRPRQRERPLLSVDKHGCTLAAPRSRVPSSASRELCIQTLPLAMRDDIDARMPGPQLPARVQGAQVAQLDVVTYVHHQ